MSRPFLVKLKSQDAVLRLALTPDVTFSNIVVESVRHDQIGSFDFFAGLQGAEASAKTPS